MRQLLQHLGTGELELARFPVGAPAAGQVQVQVRASIVSSGTERMLHAFGRAGLIGKARQQPERVKQVLDKVRAEGIEATYSAVTGRLKQPLPLGYASAGVVTAVGAGVTEFSPGDRVACNGPHAELVHVPKLLCAKIPDEVSFEDAAFTSLIAVALQGVRLIAPTLGERGAVVGLGLLGQLAVQLLRANGCSVIGVDPIAERRELAKSSGATDALTPDAFASMSGLDFVLFCASTKEPAALAGAARACRARGRIVLVGVAPIEFDRSQLYEKELSFQVSCSYGPGRYEPGYEEYGLDYPVGHVRWTAKRNFEAALGLVASGAVSPEPLVSRRARFEDAPEVYANEVLSGEALAVALEYDAGPVELASRVVVDPAPITATQGSPRVAVIGAGNFLDRVLGPLLQEQDVELVTIASRAGMSAANAARKFGFQEATTALQDVIARDDIDAVCVLTRHDSHASLVTSALRHGKHVFVEKPLALDADELDEVMDAAREAGKVLAVGFNRRFAPMALDLRRALAESSAPANLIMTINAGALPEKHWLHRPEQGGRILGEACHFVDLARALVGAPISRHVAVRTGPEEDPGATLVLSFVEGSTATIHYETRGPSSVTKERVEVFCAGGMARIDGWRTLRAWKWPGLSPRVALRQDKGHAANLERFFAAVRGDTSPWSLDELEEVSRVIIELASEVSR